MWHVIQIEGMSALMEYMNDNNILPAEVKDITASGSWFTLTYYR